MNRSIKEREKIVGTLILGSGSPRRRLLLGKLGVPFSVIVANVDEDVIVEPDPAENVRLRAQLKGEALQKIVPNGAYILTADTTVVLAGEMLNKPQSVAEAREMLTRLCGITHQVYTAVLLQCADEGIVDQTVCVTDVIMRPYTADEVEAYIETGDPFDKAGGYAIQHPMFRPVSRFDGCYSSVVGLPVCRVAQMLRTVGFDINDDTYGGWQGSDIKNCLCLTDLN